MSRSLLTDDELLAILFAAEASGPKDDVAMKEIIAWAERVLFEAEVIDLVVDGRVILDWDPVSRNVRYKLSPAGQHGWPDA